VARWAMAVIRPFSLRRWVDAAAELMNLEIALPDHELGSDLRPGWDSVPQLNTKYAANFGFRLTRNFRISKYQPDRYLLNF
jgi:hypothetical protein